MRKLPNLAAATLLLSAAALLAQQAPDPLCVQALKIPIPSTAQPRTPLPDHCDTFGLYYAGGATNLRNARYCAYAGANEISTDDVDASVDNLLSDAVLTMIYASGKGVPPNLRLATRFACQMNDWGQDGRSIAHLLDDARKKGALRLDFDICDHLIGRETDFACTVRDQGRVAKAIQLAEKPFKTGPPEQQAAFRRLTATRKALLSAHLAEVPAGARGAMRDEVDIDHAWVQTLHDLAAGNLPHTSAKDLPQADYDLNLAYRGALQTTAACDSQYCLSTDRLRQIERSWIAYRDAWVAFAALRWPSVPPDSWRAWLTLEQTKDLLSIED